MHIFLTHVNIVHVLRQPMPIVTPLNVSTAVLEYVSSI
jgi:hypothetical protein